MNKRQIKKSRKTAQRRAEKMAEKIFSHLENGQKVCLRADDYDSFGAVYTAVEFFFAGSAEIAFFAISAIFSARLIALSFCVFSIFSPFARFLAGFFYFFEAHSKI